MARTSIATPGFLDRLGDRVVVTDRTGGDLEVLRLRPELTADAAFESALKARAEQLAAFQHRGVARLRGVSRLPAPDGRLAVVSDATKGWRLSEVLQAAEHENHLVHTSAVLFILRQVAAAVGALQALGAEVAHGALGPERVVLCPGGRVVVVECALGSALAHLPAFSTDRLWKDLRLAVPDEAKGERFTSHTDVLQLGIIALSLIHNRLLRRDEYPGRLTELLDTATESRLTGERQPIGASLRRWLEQVLGLAAGSGQWTMADAQRGLDWIVSKEGGYFSTPVGLEPLLQSVDRFFTVPAASPAPPADRVAPLEAAGAAPVPEAAAPSPAPLATPAVEEVVSDRVETTPAPAAEAEPARVEPPPAPVAATAPVPTEAAPVKGVEGVAEEPRDKAPASARVLTLVHPADDHTRDPFPVPPDDLSAAPTRRPLRPIPAATPSAAAKDSGAAEVAPVADMLAVDRPTSARRSGWNGEAWQSRSSERQTTATRSMGTPTTTVRVGKSGGVATAAALRADAPPEAHHEEPAKGPDLAPREEAAREPVPAPAARSHPARPTPIVTAERRAARDEHSSSAPSPASVPSRSLFGADASAAETETDDAPRGASGGRTIWLAVAALVILCAGGFAAWRLFGGPAAPAAADAAKPAASPAATAAPSANASNPAAPTPAPAGDQTATPPTPAVGTAPADAKPATGSLQVVTSVPVSVSEKGEALGTSAAALVLPAGRHVLDLANEEVGYHATHVVDVRAGRVTRVSVALPRGSVNINATPWAEVFVDGQRVGETPLGNVQLTVGAHEVRFRHPQLGEQVRTVVVTTGAAGRLSVDMKQ